MVVFTIITNGYDRVKPIAVKNPDWRYVCITDDMTIDPCDWDLLDIYSMNPPEGLSPVKLQRWAKIIGAINYFDCPTIYIDGNYEISNDITKLWTGTTMLKKHPIRSCFIEEANACKRLNKDTPEFIDTQIQQYIANALEANGGMYETNVMFRGIGSDVKEFCNVWWGEVNKHSHRDQLSLMWAIKCSDLEFGTIDWGMINRYLLKHKHN